MAARFLFLTKLSLAHDNCHLRVSLYSSNPKNLFCGISCHNCMYSYSGIGSIKRILRLQKQGQVFHRHLGLVTMTKQMKARGCRPSVLIISECLETQ